MLNNLRLKPWPFYMDFSLFTCPSIGHLADLVGVAISTNMLKCHGGKMRLVWSCEQRLEFVAREGQEREREHCCDV